MIFLLINKYSTKNDVFNMNSSCDLSVKIYFFGIEMLGGYAFNFHCPYEGVLFKKTFF